MPGRNRKCQPQIPQAAALSPRTLRSATRGHSTPTVSTANLPYFSAASLFFLHFDFRFQQNLLTQGRKRNRELVRIPEADDHAAHRRRRAIWVYLHVAADLEGA